MYFRLKTVDFSPSDGLIGHYSPKTEYPVLAIKDSPAYVSFFVPDDEGVIYGLNEATIHRFFRYITPSEPIPSIESEPPKRGWKSEAKAN